MENMTTALERINSMGAREFEKLALRIARELGFQIRGTKVEEDRVEMDSFLSLPTGEILHYFVVFSRKNPSSSEMLEMMDRINNPFVKILYMSTGEADEETRRFCSAKGIELAEWDRLIQLLDRYGILRELEREPEKEAFLPSLGEIEALEKWAIDFLKEGNLQKSMEYVERALSIKPDLPRLLRLKGDILYKTGRNGEAEQWYRKALEKDPKDFKSWLSLSKALKEQGKSDEALIAMDRATEIRPNDYALWLEKGLMLYEKGMYDEALLSFTKATEINPDGKEAWNDRGLVLKKLGKFEEAVNSFNRAIQLDGGFWDALLNKALLLHEKGEISDAIIIYDRIIKIRRDAKVICQKGFALEEIGRTDEAVKMFEEALTIDPKLTPCREELGKLKSGVKEPKPEEIEEAVEPEVEKEPEPVQEEIEPKKEIEIGEEKPVPAGLAAIVSAIKQVEEEPEEIETEDMEIRNIRDIAEEIEEESEEIGSIFEETPEEAEEAVKEPEEAEGLELSDEEVSDEELEEEENIGALEGEEEQEEGAEVEESEIYKNLVFQEEKLKNMGTETVEVAEEQESEEPAEAEEEMEELEEGEAKEEKREGSRVMEGISSLSQLMTRGTLYYKLKRYDEAMECFRVLAEAKPNSNEIWNMYGSALFMADRYTEALKAFENAMNLDKSRETLLNIAEVYRVVGSAHEALEILNSMLKDEKDNSILWIKRGKVLSSMEREGASVQSFSKALDANSTMIRVWNAMGISLMDIDEYEDAKDAFEKGISVDERDYLLWNNYGALLYLIGDEEGAMEALERSIGEDLRYAPANNNIGVILAKRGDIKGARERFGLALESDHNSIYAYNNTKYLRP